MNKTLRLYLMILAVVMIVLVILQLNKSAIIDWRKNYDVNSKAPFGLYVFDQEADSLFGGNLERVNTSVFDYFDYDSIQGDSAILQEAPMNILLTPHFYLSDSEWERIFKRVKHGDCVFIAQNAFSYLLQDSLSLYRDWVYGLDSISLQLTDKKFQKDSLYLNHMADEYFFTNIDTTKVEILGYNYNIDSTGKIPNFVRVKYGKGLFLIHAQPLTLTNYYLLKKENQAYIEDVFSYLPQRKTLWFLEKPSDKYESQSPLRFILSNPALRYAWYLIAAALFLFVLFNIKRKQRIVPVQDPPKNSSVEFVKNIGNLYLQEGNTKDMAQKKAHYFLEKVRSDLLIDTRTLDKVFVKRLHLKTGKSIATIEAVIPLLEKSMHAQAPVQQEELVKMNELINDILEH